MSKKLLKQIKVKKAIGIDTIPPKLIKLHVWIQAKPLTLAKPLTSIYACLKERVLYSAGPNISGAILEI